MQAEQTIGQAGRPAAIVLLSGGLDSATTLAITQADGFACHTLAFDYGQRHRHELAAAARIAKAFGAASHRVIGVDLRAIGGSALTSELAVPKGGAAEQTGAGIPVTYVPARNLIFLSIAAACAEVLGAAHVFLGINAVDYSGYPDCRPEFVRAFEAAARLGTKAGVEGRPLSVHAPLVAMSKAQIIRKGVDLGVDYGLTHSCYDPVVTAAGEVLACGACDSCQLRREGFRKAGVSDPTRYAPAVARP